MDERPAYPEYPCKCGKTHSGLYGIYDYGHCNCEHPAEARVGDEMVGLEICGHCGQTFHDPEGEMAVVGL